MNRFERKFENAPLKMIFNELDFLWETAHHLDSAYSQTYYEGRWSEVQAYSRALVNITEKVQFLEDVIESRIEESKKMNK